MNRSLLLTIVGFVTYFPLAVIDYRTGSEIRFTLLYLVPIYLVTWNAGPKPGIAMCFLCALPPLIDRIRETQFVTEPFAFYWNFLYKLAFFLLVSYLLFKRKSAEDELRVRSHELARSNAELDQFASIASHDLQEPLRMIISYLQLLTLRGREKLDAEMNQFVGYAVDGAERMSALINSVLEYSRVGKHEIPFKPIDCSKVLRRSLENLHLAIQESGTSVTVDPMPVVMGAEIELVQLFQNLIANAIKFKGRLPPMVRVSARQTGARWMFTVADNGIGIDPQYQDKIFKMFQRLHSRQAYSGTGIGLAVCQKIVEMHGGKIWVESEPGRGAKFKFTLAAKP